MIVEMKNTSTKSAQYFPEVVGQEDVKRKLSFYIDGYQKTSMIPHFLFIAEKGCGKTMFASNVAKQLINDKTKRPKKAKEINCATLKSVGQFVEQIALPFIQDRECTLVFDEASELPRSLTMSLLTMLNPNVNNRNTFVMPDGNVLDIDFKKHSFMFCTTEPQKIFHALMSRCTRVDFEPYDGDDLMTILENNIKKNLKGDGITFTDETKSEIPGVLRNNPRCAQMMANDIISYCLQHDVKEFCIKHWTKFKEILGIQPLGLNASEVRVLKILKEAPNSRLTDISAKLGMTVSAIQRDIELFLLRNNLIKVENGRCLTEAGEAYLKSLA